MRFLLKLLLIISFFFGCTSIPYADDRGFINSAQANSFEAPLKLNGDYCKDIDGQVGLCVKRISDNRPLSFEIPPRPYSYSLVIKCTAGLDQSNEYDIEKGKKFTFDIKDFKGLKSFQCIGELFPNDRDIPVSAKFGVIVKVYDHQYQSRSKVYRSGRNLILGNHSKYSRVCYTNGKCTHYKKKTIIKNNKIKNIISESQIMRFSYYQGD